MWKPFLLALFLLLSRVAAAQPTEWGPKHNGVHFGLVLKDGAYGVLCEVYAEYTGPKKDHRIGLKREVSFEVAVFDQRYQAVPARQVPVLDSAVFRGWHAGPPKEWDLGMLLKRNEPALVAHYVIQRPEISWDRDCYSLREWQHMVQAKLVFPHWGGAYDSLRTRTAAVRIPYCEEANAAREHHEKMARFFQLLTAEQNPHTLALCIAMVQDPTQDRDLRHAAMHHLADVNTQAARDVLYIQCLTDDPELPYLLDHLFRTRDPRGLELFDRYGKSADETMQVYIASGIGQYRSTAHLPILRRILQHGTRWARGVAVEACQYINDEGARRILYEALHDADLGVRTDAVRYLAIIGNERSLPEVLGYLEREDPVHVGYVATGWDTVKQLAGTDFNRDLDQLRAYLKER